jgi:hypothetical protein
MLWRVPVEDLDHQVMFVEENVFEVMGALVC